MHGVERAALAMTLTAFLVRLENVYETLYIMNVASDWPPYPFIIFKQLIISCWQPRGM